MSEQVKNGFGTIADSGGNGEALKKRKEQMQASEFNKLAKEADIIFSEMFDDNFFETAKKGLKPPKEISQKEFAQKLILNIKKTFLGTPQDYENLKKFKDNKSYIYDFCMDKIDVHTMSSTFRKALIQICNEKVAEIEKNGNLVPETSGGLPSPENPKGTGENPEKSLGEKKDKFRENINSLNGSEAEKLFINIYGPEGENIIGKKLYAKGYLDGCAVIKEFNQDKEVVVNLYKDRNDNSPSVLRVKYDELLDKILDKYVLSESEFEEVEKEKKKKEAEEVGENAIKNPTLAEFEERHKDILGADLLNEKGDWIHIIDYKEEEKECVKLEAGVRDSREGKIEYFSLKDLDDLLKVYRKKENPSPENSDIEAPKEELSDIERKIIDLYKGGASEMMKCIKGIDYAGKYGYEEKDVPVLIEMETERFWKKYKKIIKEDEKISEEEAQKVIEFIKISFK